LGPREEDEEMFYVEHTPFLNKLKDPLSTMMITGDKMYLHQAMLQPDRKEFLKAMVKEITPTKSANIGKWSPSTVYQRESRCWTAYGP